MTASTDDRVPARMWTGDLGAGQVEQEDISVYLDVESDESGPGRVAVHTFVDGGSMAAYYLDREAAITLVRQILQSIEFS